eukprot:scpid57395/ scgid32006/ 
MPSGSGQLEAERVDFHVKRVISAEQNRAGPWAVPVRARGRPGLLHPHHHITTVRDVWEWMKLLVCCGEIRLLKEVARAYSIYHRCAVGDSDVADTAHEFPDLAECPRELWPTFGKADALGAVTLETKATAESVPVQQQHQQQQQQVLVFHNALRPLQSLTRGKTWRRDNPRLSQEQDGFFTPTLKGLLEEQLSAFGSPSLLHCAVMVRRLDIVQLLLSWQVKASPECTLQCRGEKHIPDVQHMTPLWLAAILQLPHIVQCLIAGGASQHENALFAGHVFGPVVSPWLVALYDVDTCQALSNNGTSPAPVAALWLAQKGRLTRSVEFLRRVVRWDRDCCRHSLLCLDVLHCDDIGRLLLGIPCLSAQEMICKAVFCQQLLHSVTLQVSTRPLARNGSSICSLSGRLPQLVRDLVDHGADPAGWSQQRAVDLCAAWNDIADHNSRYMNVRRGKPVSIAGCQEMPGYGKPLDVCPFMELNLCNYSTYHLADSEVLMSGQQWTSHCPHFHATRKTMVATKCLPPLVARLVNICRTASCASGDATLRLLFRFCGPAMRLSSLEAVPYVCGDMHDGPVCVANASCRRLLSRVQLPTSVSSLVSGVPVPTLRELCSEEILRAIGNDRTTKYHPEIVAFRWFTGQELPGD